MIWTLFIIGLLTALGCGWNIVNTGKTTWGHEAAWVVGGLGGAGLMVLAIFMRKWGL